MYFITSVLYYAVVGGNLTRSKWWARKQETTKTMGKAEVILLLNFVGEFCYQAL